MTAEMVAGESRAGRAGEGVTSTEQENTWPRPRVIQPCLICGGTAPGHVLVEGIGRDYVAQVCSSHTLFEIIKAQRDGHDLLDVVVSINDLDLAESLNPRPFTASEVDAATAALDVLFAKQPRTPA